MREQPYTPPTDEVRRGWIVGETRDGHGVDHDDLEPKVAAEFDRWLAERDRQVAEKAWDEAVDEAFSLGSLYDYDRDETLIRNPYRQEADQ